jgi:hypothetical protein
LHDVVGNGSGFKPSTNFNSGWLLETNTTIRFNTIPEPSMLGLLGLALLGAGFASKRRKGA